ncbi:hypothetical protein [Desulfoluna sp.]|uniref:hypothetical protein n=1 Tax=Desulfoluna sp. TaxID=2045199 RepID=UPI00260E0DAF|nr:hypothetical protein [Desulfoluna sp.]
MQRRDFFKSVINIPLKRLSTFSTDLRSTEMSETELFMEAMRYGIDPATLSPAELRKTVKQKQQEATEIKPSEKRAAPS